ncbi:MAG: PilC/PilY family type IV pilus protein, partial [Methylotenera sp.]
GRIYEKDGSDYLDDVAQALYEMDLRPSLDSTKKTETVSKNNLVTYAIGLADPTLQQDSVLKDAALAGGGKFFFAEDSKALASALEDTIADIASKVSSSASVVANSSKLDANSAIYQGKYDSADWTGILSMFPLGLSEDVNGNGVLDAGEDINGNGRLDVGDIGDALWNAAEHIPAFDSTSGRNILTYNSTATPKGVAFTCANLTASQKTALGIIDCANTADIGVWRLNYIRGDWSHEEKNPTRTDADTLRSSDPAVGIFRNRTHLNKKTQVKIAPDPWLLGDIVNSNPAYVSDENYRYDKLSAADGGTLYKQFVTDNATRRKMVYVGANDGMLHGFDATFGTDGGKEMLAYIPNAVYSGLNGLSSP